MRTNQDILQLWNLMKAHFIERARQPAVLFWGIGFPILMSLGLGIAFTQKPNTQRKIAILVNSNSTKIDSLLAVYSHVPEENENTNTYLLNIENEQMGNTSFELIKMNSEDALIALKRGVINLIVQEDNGNLNYSFDPLNPDAQLSYIKLSSYFGEGEARVVEATDNIQTLTLKGTRYIDFLIPGLLSMGIMMSIMWGLSYGMIENRSKKLLRRMVATPMKKSYFLISIMMVRMLMNFIEAALLILFAWIVFDISIQGSIVALFAVFIAGNIGFAGLAFFISSRTAKTEVGNGLINVVIMPMMIFSGIFFSYHNFPDKIIPVIQKLPLTLVADSMRSIFIEGAGLEHVVVSVATLLIGGTVFFILGLKMFKWY